MNEILEVHSQFYHRPGCENMPFMSDPYAYDRDTYLMAGKPVHGTSCGRADA